MNLSIDMACLFSFLEILECTKHQFLDRLSPSVVHLLNYKSLVRYLSKTRYFLDDEESSTGAAEGEHFSEFVYTQAPPDSETCLVGILSKRYVD